MPRPDMARLYGISTETESSWPDALSELHQAFILSFVEQEQAKEATVIEAFLASRPNGEK